MREAFVRASFVGLLSLSAATVQARTGPAPVAERSTVILAQTDGMERRDDRRDDRQENQKDRQDSRQENREERQDRRDPDGTDQQEDENQ